MNQYCRYCNNMICGDANYCCVKKQTFSDEKLKVLNKCKDFEFNPIDALFENENGYKPRLVKSGPQQMQGQITWEEVNE